MNNIKINLTKDQNIDLINYCRKSFNLIVNDTVRISSIEYIPEKSHKISRGSVESDNDERFVALVSHDGLEPFREASLSKSGSEWTAMYSWFTKEVRNLKINGLGI